VAISRHVFLFLEVLTMNRFVPVAAAVAALFAMSASQAAVILVDDFNSPAVAVSISDTTIGGAVTSTSTTSAASLAASREMSVDLTVKNTSTASIQGTVGGSDGFLNFSVSTGDNGIAKVRWTLPVFTLASTNNSYFFSVIASALGAVGTTSTPNKVNFAFTGSGANAGNNFSLSADVGAYAFANPGSAVNFGLNGAQSAAISGGGALVLTVEGGQGWNLTLDQFAISVPEPTSLALAGLALLGAGVASRRRKA
jgi:PEP-CTERM motif